MAELLFWGSVAFVLYVYAGYPVLLAVWARVRGRGASARHRRTAPGADGATGGAADGRSLPEVTIVIAARNEAPRLPARIDNLLASDYPADRLQIIVASDGSSDDTAEALARYRGRIELLMLPAAGKASALNAAVLRARHPILVFADARQRFAPDTIQRLAAHFTDAAIGAVSGELVLDCEVTAAQAQGAPTPSSFADGVGAYWRYEKWLRRREAIVGSTLGVTGAIYAMRRWLWQPLPLDTLLDDVLGPMRLVLRGHRVVFDPEARAFDEATKDAGAELRRKVRTLAGNFQLLRHEPRLLMPWRNPVWLQFMSHKVGRLLVPYALVAIFAASIALVRTAPLYTTALIAQLVFYGLAGYGALLDRRTTPVPAPPAEAFREAA